MDYFSPRVYLILIYTVAIACFSAVSQVQAQTQATPVAMTRTSNPSNSDSLLRPAWQDTLPNKLISAQVHDGVLTIDGMVAKVQLNYEIQHTGYLYFFVPGMGTAVVSLAPIPDAVRVKNAFEGAKLMFSAGGHTFELTGSGNLLTRDKTKTDVYVRLDSSTVAMGRYPRMGFGNTAEAPYVWPLSAPATKDRESHFVTPPPLPRSVLPRTVATNTTSSVASTNQQ
jgi:hypothetical protein